MHARDEIVGVLAVEGGDRHPPGSTERRRIGDLARAAALAIDNARWLERIHTLGMEQERTRLARELHDHIGQSVVYLGFEIDRLVELNHGRAVQADLLDLRGDLRDLVEELRDMLVDLRSDVTEAQDVEGVLRSFLERVNKRNRVEVTLVADTDSRMPLPVEREVWRVAREAVMNAERHARASHVSILWLCNDEGALLEVADDGVGLPAGKTSGESGYGLVGMRERADSIGAQLEITSGPGKGTLVRMQNEGGVMVRVLIADDHTMVREGLRWALEHAGLDVVGEAADGEEAVDMAEQHQPDVVLMDLSLPVLSGAAATKRIRTLVPGTSVLVLSMLSDDTAVSSALDAGAGWVPGEGLHHVGDRRRRQARGPGRACHRPVAVGRRGRHRRRGRSTRPGRRGPRSPRRDRSSPSARRRSCASWPPACRSPRRRGGSSSVSRPSRTTCRRSTRSSTPTTGPRPCLKAMRMGLIRMD